MTEINLEQDAHLIVTIDKKTKAVQIAANKKGLSALADVFIKACESCKQDDIFDWENFAEIKGNNAYGGSTKGCHNLVIIKVKN